MTNPTKTTYVDNFSIALKALESEVTAQVDPAELTQYLERLDEVVETCKLIRGNYKRELANMASAKSRAKRQDRIVRALALLDEAESAESSVTS